MFGWRTFIFNGSSDIRLPIASLSKPSWTPPGVSSLSSRVLYILFISVNTLHATPQWIPRKPCARLSDPQLIIPLMALLYIIADSEGILITYNCLWLIWDVQLHLQEPNRYSLASYCWRSCFLEAAPRKRKGIQVIIEGYRGNRHSIALIAKDKDLCLTKHTVL